MSQINGKTNSLPSGLLSKIFYSRPGAVDEGRIFEELTVANLCFDLIFNDEVENFAITSNEHGMGAFDDIVLDLKYNNHEEIKIAMQLKYKTNDKRSLTMDSLLADKGDCSLRKYMNDYNKLSKKSSLITILLVKKSFQAKNKNGFVVGETENRFPFFEDCKCHQFAMKSKDFQKNQEYEDFFKNFYLFTTQTSVQKIEKDISEKFHQRFSPEAPWKPYIEFIRKWCCDSSSKKLKLDKKSLKEVLSLKLLDPYSRKFSFSGLTCNEKLLFIRATAEFTVTHLGEDKEEEIIKIGIDVKNQLPDSAVCDKISRFYQLKDVQSSGELNDDECTKILWLTKKCPLVVTDNEIVRKAIDLCQDLPFVLLSRDFNYLPNIKQFRYLADLEAKPEIFENFLSQLNCRFQGKVINLETFAKINKEISKLISTDELLLMVENRLHIDMNAEELPDAYIDRYISHNIISNNILNNVDKDTIILIDTDAKSKQKLDYLRIQNIIITDEKEFKLKNPNKACHVLHYNKEEKFEWVRSNCSVRQLKNYLLEDVFLPEKELRNYEGDVNVVCGGPGIGKTTFLKNLKNNGTSDLWTLFICVRNHSAHFREKGDNIKEFENYLLTQYEQKLNPFEHKMFKIFLNSNKLRFLWDGLDELSDKNFLIVKSIIQELSKNGSKHWLTSRDNLKINLEEEFKVISRTLKVLDEEEQKQYIQKRLKRPEDETSTIFEKIKNNIKLFPNNTILETPLQIHLLTQLFVQNFDKYSCLLDGVFTIVDLYQHFVEEKFKIYFEEKEKIIVEPDTPAEGMLKDFKNKHLDYYEKNSLQLYFDEQQLEELDVSHNCSNESEIFKVGFITKIMDSNIPEFIHNSFGEFFAACYLAKHFPEIPNLLTKIFDEKYSNIRFFLDVLLSKNCNAHIAVLYQNWQLLASCTDSDFMREDKAGRHCLQLMCSWGAPNKFLDLKLFIRWNVEKTVRQNYIPKIKKNMVYIEKLTLLSKKCNPFKKDLFSMNSIDYTVKSQCDLTLGIMATLAKVKIIDGISNIFLNCIMHDYHEILPWTKFQPTDLFETLCVDLHFEHFLVLFNSSKCWKEILNNDSIKNKIKINIRNGSGKTPIHYACEMGYLTITKFLIENGAMAEVRDNYAWKPIHYACQQGHLEIVKFLIGKGVNAEVENRLKLRPIHYASQRGHLQIVKFLTEKWVNVNAEDKDGWKPIHHACQQGHLEIVKLLAEKTNVENRLEMKPIVCACQEGHLEIVKFLIAQEVNTELRDTLIHYACRRKQWKIVKFLIEIGANADVRGRDELRPLHYACQHGQLEIVQLLIKEAANSEAENKFKMKPIHYACQQGNLEIVKFLLENGVNASVEDGQKQTPIYYACENGHLEIVKILIENGVDVYVESNNKWTPIHIACANGHIDIVKFLIEIGINADVGGEDETRPIHIACTVGNLEIVELLIDNGVDVDVEDRFKNKPIYYAHINEHSEIVDLLLVNGVNLG